MDHTTSNRLQLVLIILLCVFNIWSVALINKSIVYNDYTTEGIGMQTYMDKVCPRHDGGLEFPNSNGVNSKMGIIVCIGDLNLKPLSPLATTTKSK